MPLLITTYYDSEKVEEERLAAEKAEEERLAAEKVENRKKKRMWLIITLTYVAPTSDFKSGLSRSLDLRNFTGIHLNFTGIHLKYIYIYIYTHTCV